MCAAVNTETFHSAQQR